MQKRSLPQVARTIAFQAHREVCHRLDDGLPYEFHLELVAAVVRHYTRGESLGELAEIMEAAAYLHDTLEDTHLSYNDVRKALLEEVDEEVATTVVEIAFALTNHKGRNRKERASATYYSEIRGTKGAIVVKLANMAFSLVRESRQFEMYQVEMTYFLNRLDGGEDETVSVRDRMVQDLQDLANRKTEALEWLLELAKRTSGKNGFSEVRRAIALVVEGEDQKFLEEILQRCLFSPEEGTRFRQIVEKLIMDKGNEEEDA